MQSWCLGPPPSTCAHDYVLAFLASPHPKMRKRRFFVERVRTTNSLVRPSRPVGGGCANRPPGRESRGSCALIFAPRCPWVRLLVPELKLRQSRRHGHRRGFGGRGEGSERFMTPRRQPRDINLCHVDACRLLGRGGTLPARIYHHRRRRNRGRCQSTSPKILLPSSRRRRPWPGHRDPREPR